MANSTIVTAELKGFVERACSRVILETHTSWRSQTAVKTGRARSSILPFVTRPNRFDPNPLDVPVSALLRLGDIGRTMVRNYKLEEGNMYLTSRIAYARNAFKLGGGGISGVLMRAIQIGIAAGGRERQ